TVLLVNGDRLLLDAPGAPSAVRVLPGAASALAGGLVALGSGRSGLVIPQTALPYLGRGLDPALFRPGSLPAAGIGGPPPGGLAGSPAGAARAALAPRHSPRFRMHTLTVTATDTSGQPDTGDDVLVLNADSIQRFDDFIETDNFFNNGVTKYSVPAGHCWAI